MTPWAADDRAFFLKVRDVVQTAVSEATVRQVAMKFQQTRDIRLTGDPVKTVELLANRYTLNDIGDSNCTTSARSAVSSSSSSARRSSSSRVPYWSSLTSLTSRPGQTLAGVDYVHGV